MSAEKIEVVVVEPNKIEPLWVYLGVLFVVGVWAASNPLSNMWYHLVGRESDVDPVDEDERRAQVARSRSNMQQRLNATTGKKTHPTSTMEGEADDTPLVPRVVSLRHRGNRGSGSSGSNGSSGSSGSSGSRRSSNDNDTPTTTNPPSRDSRTDHDALYAASLQALQEETPPSSAMSDAAWSNLSPGQVRARQDVAYENSLRQDHQKRKEAETMQQKEMQRAIQTSMVEEQERQQLETLRQQLETLQQRIPVEPTEMQTTTKKIQFRFASGHTLKRNFDGKNTLGQVRAFVRCELYSMTNQMVRCTMSTTYPRKTYGEKEDALTLEESGMFDGGANTISLMVQDVDA